MRVVLASDKPGRFDHWSDLLRREGLEVQEATLEEVSLRAALLGPSSIVVVVDCSEGSRLPAGTRQILNDRTGLLLAAPHQALEDLEAEECDDVLDVDATPAEALYRIRRAFGRLERTPPALQVAELVIQPGAGHVTLQGQPVRLRQRELELLRFLAARPNRVFSREGLAREVWGPEYPGSLRTVDAHLSRLRRRLGRFGEEHLQTVRGVGYRLAARP